MLNTPKFLEPLDQNVLLTGQAVTGLCRFDRSKRNISFGGTKNYKLVH